MRPAARATFRDYRPPPKARAALLDIVTRRLGAAAFQRSLAEGEAAGPIWTLLQTLDEHQTPASPRALLLAALAADIERLGQTQAKADLPFQPTDQYRYPSDDGAGGRPTLISAFAGSISGYAAACARDGVGLKGLARVIWFYQAASLSAPDPRPAGAGAASGRSPRGKFLAFLIGKNGSGLSGFAARDARSQIDGPVALPPNVAAAAIAATHFPWHVVARLEGTFRRVFVDIARGFSHFECAVLWGFKYAHVNVLVMRAFDELHRLERQSAASPPVKLDLLDLALQHFLVGDQVEALRKGFWNDYLPDGMAEIQGLAFHALSIVEALAHPVAALVDLEGGAAAAGARAVTARSLRAIVAAAAAEDVTTLEAEGKHVSPRLRGCIASLRRLCKTTVDPADATAPQAIAAILATLPDLQAASAPLRRAFEAMKPITRATAHEILIMQRRQIVAALMRWIVDGTQAFEDSIFPDPRLSTVLDWMGTAKPRVAEPPPWFRVLIASPLATQSLLAGMRAADLGKASRTALALGPGAPLSERWRREWQLVGSGQTAKIRDTLRGVYEQIAGVRSLIGAPAANNRLGQQATTPSTSAIGQALGQEPPSEEEVLRGFFALGYGVPDLCDLYDPRHLAWITATINGAFAHPGRLKRLALLAYLLCSAGGHTPRTAHGRQQAVEARFGLGKAQARQLLISAFDSLSSPLQDRYRAALAARTPEEVRDRFTAMAAELNELRDKPGWG